MAKAKSQKSTEPTAAAALSTDTAEPQISPDDIKVAVRCVCCVTGCGSKEAAARVANMSSRDIAKLVAAERSNNRRAAVPVLYSRPTAA
ncbi:hypothetical protein [Aureliella helgolandensis]|uniref:Uncharacterized protein n=1 Tax=Aureliella helgolandensis TaxID=2527968 RepID=A0A518G2W8_9BACT|nr:hypothetical protein [Aureliella helgolandensis]QDV22932.1 hypothetical protein Q31a_12250 [Aureliella helgolandensis]